MSDHLLERDAALEVVCVRSVKFDRRKRFPQ